MAGELTFCATCDSNELPGSLTCFSDYNRIAPLQGLNYPLSKGTEALPIIEPLDLLAYDGILFGVATGHGQSTSSEWRSFWDKTGGIWLNRGYFHKSAGMLVSSAISSTGRDSMFVTGITGFAHHGMYFVPLGYKYAKVSLENVDELHGGSIWGAGTYSVSDKAGFPTSDCG